MPIRTSSLCMILAALTAVCSTAQGAIETTPHNLAATEGGNICSFCHTPHGALAGTPLWNHQLSTAVYRIYQSSSLEADVGQPTGSSKLCLSCHDGTVALAESIASNGQGGAYITPGAANLGTDLSDDHPISFVYSAALSAEDPQIKPPSALDENLKLDRGGELQCTTCHNPHDNQFGDFLVMDNVRSQMCVSCHNLNGWTFSTHQRSSAPTATASDSYLQNSKYSTVAGNGCGGCHRPHSAGGRERLLHFATAEDNCLSCHDGSVATTNVKSQMNKISGHDVTKSEGLHDPVELPHTVTNHVECTDCHNPHMAENSTSQAPVIRGAMRGVSGINMSGAFTAQAQFEYEVCFKCHSDNPTRVTTSFTRLFTQNNTRLEFDSSNASYHPITTSGASQNVPSLISPMTVASLIYCTDCHNSDSASGVKGPHGSNFRYLLSERYETSDFTIENSASYALCYKCHSRNSILNDESFPHHREHLEQEVPCSACHDPHGITSAQGTSSNSTHLINFDLTIVSSDPTSGRLEFEDLGTYEGRCYLKCHNVTHGPREY